MRWQQVVPVLAAAAIAAFFIHGSSGYTYNKNDLTIPPGVTCQMQVRSWASETGTATMNAVVSDLDAVHSDITRSDAGSLAADLNALVSDTGNFSQDMPPGCVPGLMSYERTEAQDDTAIDSAAVPALYDLRTGKPVPPAEGEMVQAAAARMRAAASSLAAYAK